MTSDEGQNLPAVPEQQQVVHSLQMPVVDFEGEMIRIMHGKIPALTLAMDYGYRRGTHVKLELELEVIGISVGEVKTNSKNSEHRKGDLIREHTFALREAKIVGVYSAEQADLGVGGGLAATGHDIEDEDGTETETETKLDESPEGDIDGGQDGGQDGQGIDPGF